MRRFALFLLLLLTVSAFADYATNVQVIEEVETPAVAPEVDDAIGVMVDQLAAENNTFVEVPEENNEEITPGPVAEESITVATEVEINDTFSADVSPGPVAEEISPSVVEQEGLTVIEQIDSPPVAPIVEDALNVMVGQLENSEQPVVPETEQPIVEELPSMNETNISEAVAEETPVVEIPIEPVPAGLAVIDAEGKELESEIFVQETSVSIEFKEGPLKEMNLLNVVNASELPRVDEVPLNTPAPEGSWAQIYAIDPTKTDFELGIVEVVAKGVNLYKCKDWIFDERSCSGNWELIAEDLVPGNTYYLEISPNDPGFGETSPDTGTSDGGNYLAIDEGFSSTVNTFTSTQVNDGVYFAIRRTNAGGANADLEAYLNLTYNLTNLTTQGISINKFKNLTFVLEHCFNDDIAGGFACGGGAPGGTIENPLAIELFNWTSHTFQRIGTYNGSSINEGNASVIVTSGISDFVNSTTRFVEVRYLVNVTITVNGNDAAFGADFAPLTVGYDNVSPNISNANVTPTSPFTGNNVCLRVNVTDVDSNVSSVIATIDRPVGADENLNLFDTNTCNSIPNDNVFSNLYLVGQEGVHNWTRVNVTDGVNNSANRSVGLTFEGFAGGPAPAQNTFTPTNATFNSGESLNLSLINFSDDIYAKQTALLGNEIFMFFNWSLNVTGTITNSSVSVEHNYDSILTPVVKLQIKNGSVWQNVCNLSVSTSDITDVCDIDSFINGNASRINNLQVRANLSNITIATLQSVDYVSMSVANSTVVSRILDVLDSNNNSVEFTEAVLRNSSGMLDLQLNFTNNGIVSIMIFDFNESSPLNDIRLASNVSDDSRFRNAFAIDLSNLSFSTANVTGTAVGNALYKCANYTISNTTCNDGYELLMNLTPGQNYTFILNATDPGFGDQSPDEGTPDDGNYVAIDDGFSSTVNTFTALQANDGVYFAVRRNNGAGASLDLEAYLNISYNLTNLVSQGITPGRIRNFSFRMEHCFNDDIAGGFACGGGAPGGTIENPLAIELFNFTSQSFQRIATYTGSSINEGNATANVSSGFTDFINSTTNFVNIRYLVNVTITVAANDAAFGADFSPLIITFEQAAVNKTDFPDPVTRGAQLNYTILVNNSFNATIFNVTVVEGYPSGVVFHNSSPAPNTSNNIFFLGNMSGNTSTTVNITVNVSSSVANGTILNNTVNVTYANSTGFNTTINTSQLTTVRGFPFIFTNKSDTPDPVVKGTTLRYQILINNSGDDNAFNVTVVDVYPSGVIFNGSSPVPSVANGTFSIGNLSPNQTFTINITVNVSAALANGTILNNSYNVTFANVSGVNFTVVNSTLTTVRGFPFIFTNKSDAPDPVTAGSQLNYSIFINNTGDDNAFNVTVVEGYPSGVTFHNSSLAPSSGNNVFSIGNLSPNQTFTINITVNVSSGVAGGTILNNSYNVTFANVSGVNFTVTNSTLTTVQGVVVTVSKSDIPDPVLRGSQLNYSVLINNSGNETIFNVTLVEFYPNVTFHNSSPAPSSGNNTFLLGNLSANTSTTLNITVNVSASLANGTILNNTVNVTFNSSNGTSTNITASALTTVLADFAPAVTILSPAVNSSFLLNETVNITANITNGGTIDTVRFQITFPNGSSQNFTTGVSGSLYNVTFTNLTQRGNYTIRVFANDTSGNLNNSETRVFTRRSLDIIDIVDDANVFLNYSVSVNSNSSGMLNLTANISNKRVQQINITLHNETSVFSILMVDDETPVNQSASFVVYGLDPSGLSFTNATARVNASGNNQVHKCGNFNFTSNECIGNWTVLSNIARGQVYVFSFNATDPGFLETSASVDVGVAPINLITFVVAFIDAAEGDVSFRIMNTNGSIIVNTTDVDTSADNDSRVDVGVINLTDFVIAWIDGPDDDVTMQIWRFNGTNVTNVTSASDIDTDVGLNTDVGVSEIGDRYFVCYADDVSNAADFQGFNNTNGASLVAATSVDGNIGPELPLQNLIDCYGINNTRWTYFWFDDQVFNDATYSILSESGATVVAATDIDTDVGETAQVAVTNLNRNSSGLVWYDSTDDDISIAIVSAAGVTLAGPTDVDTDAGTESRVAAGAVRRNDTATEDLFVFAWQDNASADIKASVYTAAGVQVTAPFTVNSSINTTFRLIDVTGRDPITGNTLCPGRFIVAYSNSTGASVFNGFFVNGTPWDGTCGPNVITNKSDSPDPVIKGTTLTYRILINNTNAVDTAFNVTVVENYPTGVIFNGSSPAPSSGNNTFSLGNISPGGSATVNITVNVSTSVSNGTFLNNSYNVTFLDAGGSTIIVTNSTLTLVLGFPVINVTKTDIPDPVENGSTLIYRITVTNTGDDDAFNVTVVEEYPPQVTFNGSSPVPNVANGTFLLGNFSPNQTFTINITVNVSANFTGLLNDTVNVTFANVSGVNMTVNASAQTTVGPPTPPPPPGPSGGGGGGGSRYYVPIVPVCVNGSSVIIGGKSYTTCCADDYCKTLGDKWSCVQREGFNVCELPQFYKPSVEAPEEIKPETAPQESKEAEIQKPTEFEKPPEKESVFSKLYNSLVSLPKSVANKVSSTVVSAFSRINFTWLVVVLSILAIGALVIIGSVKRGER